MKVNTNELKGLIMKKNLAPVMAEPAIPTAAEEHQIPYLPVQDTDLPEKLQRLTSLTVPAASSPLSVNHALRQSGISQAMRRRLRREGLCVINGSTADWAALLTGGDQLQVYLPLTTRSPEEQLEPWPMSLDIRFEDEHLLVINKPFGLLMHPTSSERRETLANAIAAHYSETGQAASFHPVHRLDRNTSGLVIIAKSPVVQHAFSRQKAMYGKWYEAILEGELLCPALTLHWPIGRRSESIIERCCTRQGKAAHTDLQCLQAGSGLTWVRLQLFTGRTHQIRVHCAQLGYPLAGDDLYGGHHTLISRQALHASRLFFRHPITGEDILLTAPLPADMASLLAIINPLLIDPYGGK